MGSDSALTKTITRREEVRDSGEVGSRVSGVDGDGYRTIPFLEEFLEAMDSVC